MSDAERSGRQNQKARTRKDLLQAASRLAKQGRTPTLDEIAEAALISRATAYRYFPNVESLLIEAAVDIATPEPEALFRHDGSVDPLARLQRVETALHDMMHENELLLRTMLASAIQRDMPTDESGRLLKRQNRRTPLIEAAIAPARDQFRPNARKLLQNALALVMGPEAMIVAKDVLQLDDAEARNMQRWAIRALVEAAKRPGTDE
ncbi:MAG: TetR/AcrR family transcriptional regulator [Methylocystis sp.]|uniref:TetR/AcrR family transcriptional regulator n=1 Tax=Methylocystis sp. TaxID=1911079 RepID=UPI003D11F8D8